MNDLERLIAIEAIKQLKARFLRCMDTKDWDGFAATLSDDAVLDMSAQGSEVLEGGGRAIAAWTRDAVDRAETVHHAHTPEIDVTSPDSATGVWALLDVLRWPAGEALSEMGPLPRVLRPHGRRVEDLQNLPNPPAYRYHGGSWFAPDARLNGCVIGSRPIWPSGQIMSASTRIISCPESQT